MTDNNCIYIQFIDYQPFYIGRGKKEEAELPHKKSLKWRRMTKDKKFTTQFILENLTNRAAGLIQSSLVQTLNRFYLLANLDIPVEYQGTALLDHDQTEKTLKSASVEDIQLEISNLEENLADVLPLVQKLECYKKAIKLLKESNEANLKSGDDFLSVSAFCTNLQKGKLISNYMFVKKRVESIILSKGIQAFDKIFIKDDKVIKYKCYRPADLWSIYDENKVKWQKF